MLGRKKRISEVTLELFETGSLRVNDNEISFLTFGGAGAGSPLDQPVIPFTGEKTIEGIAEYDDKGRVFIWQEVPVDMTVLGFSMAVGV